MPVSSKPHAPIAALGRAGIAAAAGVAAAASAPGVSAGGGVGGVEAGLLDPQPASVARVIANRRVFTFALRARRPNKKVVLAYQALQVLQRCDGADAAPRSHAATWPGRPVWRRITCSRS